MCLQFKPVIHGRWLGFMTVVLAASGWATTAQAAKDGGNDAPDIKVFKGICDASAAMAVGPNTFLVADDEKSDVIRVYKSSGGEPTDAKVKLPAEWADKEADLEGAAKVGSTVYWISSHAYHEKKGKREARRQFFATDASLKVVGKPYQGLLEQILGQPWAEKYNLKEASGMDPEGDGLNIEGLAAWGTDGVLMGLRSPLSKNNDMAIAIAIPLENPSEVVKGTATARLGEPLEFNLEGLGIRSIEKVGNAYWIVAGPKGRGANDGDDKDKDKDKKKSALGGDTFKLFSWSGRRDDQPVLNRDLPMGMNFEALFEMNGKLWVLSDDGQVRKGSKECKKLPESEQQFRGVLIEPEVSSRKP